MRELTAPEPRTIGTELHDVELRLTQLERRRDSLRSELLESMQAQHIKSVHLDDGTVYTRAQRHTLKVKDEARAMKWAGDNYALKVDTTKAAAILRRQFKLPTFFKVVKSEYLTIRRNHEKIDELNAVAAEAPTESE